MSYVQVLAGIAEAARAAGRDPSTVTLTAACKQQPWSRVADLLIAGHRCFGENRVEEAARRWSDPCGASRRPGVELRLIGRLQSNKTAAAVALFDVIETLDRPSLAEALTREFARQDRVVRLLVQVNTGEEAQKGGVAPPAADAFIATCRERYGLAVEGLMCIPPAGEPAAPHFALLANIGARNGLKFLSMGMSADFATAIRFGATHVRLGSALFGGRAAEPVEPAVPAAIRP